MKSKCVVFFTSKSHYSTNNFDLNDNQKRIFIFVREVNAVDNSTASQIYGYAILTANADLRKFRELRLLNQKGKSKLAYYTTSELLQSYISRKRKSLVHHPKRFRWY